MNIILEIKRILQLTKILLEIKVLFIKTIIYKKCTIGPFVGEFGHLLSYVLPFVSYLHSKGVKVIYCGPSIHKHFFYDENKKLITDEYIELRDFYNEVSPNCNELIVPNDLKTFVNKFIENSKTNNIPFWNISDHFFLLECIL